MNDKINYFLVLFFSSTFFLFGATPANLTATHRHGQTFLVWDDVSGAAKYRIYRLSRAFSPGDLISANRVAEIDSGSSYNRPWSELRSNTLSIAIGFGHLKIENGGDTLRQNQELFVWTCLTEGGGGYFYAVTAVTGATEDASISAGNNIGPVAENQCIMIYPVEQARTKPDSSGRLYVHWMPYEKWNTQMEGYTYIFFAACKDQYRGQVRPIEVNVHGRGAYYAWIKSTTFDSSYASHVYAGEDIIVYFDDPKLTWHYGFADDLDLSGSKPAAKDGSIVKNYTEYRNWCALRWLCSGDAPWTGDVNNIHINGHSMGGTGSMTFAHHHPELFSYVTSSEGINNWVDCGTNGGTYWGESVEWGFTSPGVYKTLGCHDLIPEKGDWNALIVDRDVGFSSVGWQSVRDSVLPAIANLEDIPSFNFSHGTWDNTIEWLTQGLPVWGNHNDNKYAVNRIPYSGGYKPVGHTTNWSSQNPLLMVPKNHFVLALKSATSDDSIVVDSCYIRNCYAWGQFNYRVNWSTFGTPIHKTPIDSPSVFETTIQLYDNSRLSHCPDYTGPGVETVDITPRRLQHLVHYSNSRYHWVNISVATSDTVQSGEVTADQYGLFTIEGFRFDTVGNVLRVTLVDSGYVDITNIADKKNGISLRMRPNPFNPSTVVMLECTNARIDELATIEIYSLTGKRIIRSYIHSFAHSSANATYEYIWNAENQPSGLYIIKASVYGRTISKRVMLVK
ncbi:MAG: hypothetical protein A2487_13625 [Candidatus Raymondbacteria bacterium RifOxyC12_full_50_8]|uniref:Secretion system C-terminal sorting domain-containing protein n=1 Tax=Candidatus Raymondbacteria bacterium RIFOXYD12_FULL_49_13 TaxID=1817890 RepID=A0A1F7F6L3_UNCRA|nr:MAG: hypothetical protein A2487_13625 [Candidatus Raymondbacteria bacterium RifOxyC12_full_50_8]OGK02167.1 MAG: hypothetical protein A2519_19025 [Candidatus Raymondbacteria bacterium RIFOXYD12_FULL_49_13]